MEYLIFTYAISALVIIGINKGISIVEKKPSGIGEAIMLIVMWPFFLGLLIGAHIAKPVNEIKHPNSKV